MPICTLCEDYYAEVDEVDEGFCGVKCQMKWNADVKEFFRKFLGDAFDDEGNLKD